MHLPISRHITIDGAGGSIELAIREAGVGGRPLLLVHGFTGSGEDFMDMIEPLAADGWHVVAQDQRGHGESHKAGDEAAYAIDHYVTDLLALLDALGWDQTVVLGHSMGGMIVQAAVLAAPERFRAVVLMDTAHRALRAEDTTGIELICKLVRDEGMPGVHAFMESIGGNLLGGEAPAVARINTAREGYLDFGKRKLLACDPAMYAAMLQQIAGVIPHEDRLPRLSSITVPTLVLVGEQDRPFLKASRRMADAIPGAELVVIPDAAHSPQFENPEAWLAAMRGFLATVPVSV
jgi:pimeloyl-ACP methyl ester carboxylesterase